MLIVLVFGDERVWAGGVKGEQTGLWVGGAPPHTMNTAPLLPVLGADPSRLYVVVDMMLSAYGIPVFMSHTYETAYAVYKTYTPHSAHSYALGQTMVQLCEYRVEPSGRVLIHLYKQRQRKI